MDNDWNLLLVRGMPFSVTMTINNDTPLDIAQNCLGMTGHKTWLGTRPGWAQDLAGHKTWLGTRPGWAQCHTLTAANP